VDGGVESAHLQILAAPEGIRSRAPARGFECKPFCDATQRKNGFDFD